MVKKKKPVANPARGFATTSIASKPKSEPLTAEPEHVPESVNAEVVSESRSSSTKTPLRPGRADSELVRERETQELSPDELEKRLDEGELQGLVDRFAVKARRDASRNVAKLSTDYRVLRGHAEPFTLLGVLSETIVERILLLAAQDVNSGKLIAQDEKQARKLTLPEDDVIVKVWTLEHALITMGFTESHVEIALKYILEFPPTNTEPTSSLWGLEECLDWLALNISENDLPQIGGTAVKLQDGSRTNSVTETASGTSTPPTAILSKKPSADTLAAAAADSNRNDTIEESNASEQVSDLDSDMEPEDLMTAYISAKLRLYELQPDLTYPDRSTRSGNRSTQKTAPSNDCSSTTSKLQTKIKKIESDMLFDKDEAEQRWLHKRNQKAQEHAERKRLHLSTTTKDIPNLQSGNRLGRASRDCSVSRNSTSGTNSDEEDAAFADLFGSGGMDPIVNGDSSVDQNAASIVTIRDFGPLQGMNPWRVLEEACKARDSQCSISFSLVSRAAFAVRHTVTVKWSKAQEFQLPLQYNVVTSSRTSNTWSFTMTHIATPDAQQSKAYISTYALFQIFSAVPKEEKVYLRLGPSWRGLWVEFSDLQKSQVEADNRETVRRIRDLVRESKDLEKPEDVVMTRNFEKRLAGRPAQSSVTSLEADLSSRSTAMAEDLAKAWHIKANSSAFGRMLLSRRMLPIFNFRESALSTVEQNQVTILCGETGCGKSTQMPSFILERELSQGRQCRIYCTEPRRISAITLAQRVSEELGESKHELGTSRSLVGYAIRLESKVSSSTRLIYATTGIVLRMLESAEGLQDVTHLVIDEVHERSIETDFLLIILKSLIIRRPDLRVILMSATVDSQRFSNYFHGAPVINVPGRTFPVNARFLEDAIELTGYTAEESEADGAVDAGDAGDADEIELSTNDAVQARQLSSLQGYSVRTRNALAKFDEYRIDFGLIVKLINKIAFSAEFQDFSKAILIFLPGIAEIRRLNDMLHGSKLSRLFMVHMLHSSIASDEQQSAFALPPRGLKKIVLSTNIAETGVTIPDITCVIDTGKHKEMRFDERRQISRLIESFIARANAKQRRGRAGRVQEGLCFHLFTKTRHDELIAEQQTPEMLRLSLQDLVMRVKICKLGDVQSALSEALDPPSAKNVQRAIDALIDVGALNSSEALTPLGQQLSKLPLDPYLGKLILFGALFGCLDICLTLAATLTSKSPFLTPVGARSQVDAVRQYFKLGDSDLLTDFNAYVAWRRICSQSSSTPSSSSEMQFCRKNLLSLQTLCNIEDLKAQLLSSIAETGIVHLSSVDRASLSRVQNSVISRVRRFVPILEHHNNHAANTELVSSVIAWSFYPKLLTKDGKGWRNVGTNQSISIHPTSILRSSNWSHIKFLSFYSILQSSGTKNYNASSLTPVSPFSMLLLAGDASFHPTAHVVSIDGARLRFAFEGWKAAVACKYLRRRLQEILDKTWKAKANITNSSTTNGKSNVPGMATTKGLESWTELWNDIIASWSNKVRA